jgi:protoporphyrin/coproporphyrin ferrochelatase
MKKYGVLLVNLGTPDDTSVKSVRRYLKEFLLDPRVIDLPSIFRYLLVYGIILPFRPKRSAKAYEKIWTKKGSPLRTHSEDLLKCIQKELGESYEVALGMRYGKPSIASAVQQIKGVDKIMILPLFPQYASASTGSAVEEALSVISSQWNIPGLTVINQFYESPYFIDPMSLNIQAALNDKDSFLLLSYHGLPVRHLEKSNCQTKCDKIAACPAVSIKNEFCYRAQCYATSRAIAKNLNLKETQFQTSFQSRLGRTPWIHPYTDEILSKLKERGVKKLVVACPAFVADCLETTEEIGIALRAKWLGLGGETFSLVPCVNSDEAWVNGLSAMIKQHAV